MSLPGLVGEVVKPALVRLIPSPEVAVEAAVVAPCLDLVEEGGEGLGNLIGAAPERLDLRVETKEPVEVDGTTGVLFELVASRRRQA